MASRQALGMEPGMEPGGLEAGPRRPGAPLRTPTHTPLPPAPLPPSENSPPPQGWGPLCRFLGRPEPDGPFPFENDGPRFRAGIRVFNAAGWVLAALAAAAATAAARALARAAPRALAAAAG